MSPSPSAATPRQDPYAAFRPRRGRKVAVGVAVAALVIFTAGAISVPQGDPLVGGWSVVDRLTLVLIGVAIAVLMWRYATIRAVPTREGLVVRNLFTTRRLAWPQIVRVQFGGGAPWVSLDLDDTDTVAVMAIQKADGGFSRAEAGRLSALVQVNGERPDPR